MLKLNYVFPTLLLWAWSYLALLQAKEPNEPFLILDAHNEFGLPRNFRMCSDPFQHSFQEKTPTRAHLDQLQASASGQFSENTLKTLLKTISKIPSQIFIVDLRQESHGFINGMAVCWRSADGWSNRGKTLAEVERDQTERLQEVGQQGTVFIGEKKQKDHFIEIEVEWVALESELVTSLGAHYFHLPVTDYMRPTDGDVDIFIEFIKKLPENSWLHFHCCAGKGRSGTFFAMYDMLNNAKSVSLQDIFARQALIGGKDFEADPDPTKVWKHELARKRLEFLYKFYQYCLDCPYLEQSWSAWSSSH